MDGFAANPKNPVALIILAVSIVLGGFVGKLGGSLFEYIQSLYAFFAPPFAAVFGLGILWRQSFLDSPLASQLSST